LLESFSTRLIGEKTMVHKFVPTFFGQDFDKVFVGFDEQFNQLAKLHDDLTKNIPNYPPYNIKKTDENKYVIEIAVAGFAKQDIEIEIDGDKLTVKGSTQEDKSDYVFKGIANRAFTRTFALNEQTEVKDAEMFNGMLKVFLERVIPEHKKPKKIEVKDAKASKKQLLTEEEQDAITETL
jgi:molecular chaperone IbpA